MSKLLRVTTCAALLASPAAMAGVTGNVGAVSDYVFRGITQTAGPAIQGGIDLETDIGIYAGTWASNVAFGGANGVLGTGTEQDFYVGWGGEFGLFSVSGGLTYYWYPEEGEAGTGLDELSTLEVGLSMGVGPVSLSVAHGPETNFFAGDGQAKEATYISLAYEQSLTDSLSLGVAIGQYSGKEIERLLGPGEDSYIDFSLGLSKEIEGGYSASFTYSVTDFDAKTNMGFDDDPKLIVGISKSFDL